MKTWRIHNFETVTSTMDVAKEILIQDPSLSHKDGIAILAQEQANGRGRQGRPWQSPIGNFYCSFAFTPRLGERDLPLYSFAAIVALFQAVSRLTEGSISLGIKWPNDLLLDQKKVAGILLEVVETLPKSLVVGVGVNLVSTPVEMPYPAADLKTQMQVEISPQDFLHLLLPRMTEAFDLLEKNGFSPIREAWLATRYPQDLISVRLDKQDLQGTFVDLDERGQLILQEKSTLKMHVISAGDVYF